MFRSVRDPPVRCPMFVVRVATLLGILGGVLLPAPSTIDIPIPITDPVVSPDNTMLQRDGIDIPMPDMGPFIG
jgi:hypothetical protein